MWAVRFSLLTVAALSGAALMSASVRAAPSIPALPAGWPSRMAAMLPQPGQSVQPMEWRSSGLTVELPQRVAQLGGDREALRAALTKVARGELPEYDQRLGISRAEFDSYLVFQSSLAPVGKRLKLPLTREGNRLKFGDASGLGGVLRGLVLDLTTGELRTPEGFGGRPQPFTPLTDQERRLAVRSGLEWNIRGNNPYTQNGVKATLRLLHLASGQFVLDYDRFSMLRGATSQGRVILQYTR
ncbi:hypothetical protein [Deinococcus budaensis]|uniref:Uncharacterized protein n=1 Tax=Deinococcus budaensis TaxID=1665626 RepID=A0A7W8LQ96_9DEIO|nr:hypothetical protein [Deinococcus budaensis]MBB5234380.1 hypothetical protein [Deinococcus budaensis]